MEWQISFYNQKVESETLSFPAGILANFLHIAEMIEEFGPALGAPYTKAMGEGLFEIRAKGKDQTSSCGLRLDRRNREIILLHGDG